VAGRSAADGTTPGPKLTHDAWDGVRTTQVNIVRLKLKTVQRGQPNSLAPGPGGPPPAPPPMPPG
ncbi:MAG: hypothetical protein AB7S92_18860, partial [Parvibaculaceae bacterium]